MKLANKLLNGIAIAGLCCATSLPIVSLASCKSDIAIKTIEIWGHENVVQPGHTLRMIYSCKPRPTTTPKIKWELIDVPELLESVTINSKGVINVPGDIEIPQGDAEILTVKASVVGKESVHDTATITVVPVGSEGFIGFKDNIIKYLDPNKEETQMAIINKGNKKYETEGNIDLFLNDPVQKPWTAPIDFTPLFAPGADINMKFGREGHEEDSHSSNDIEPITWYGEKRYDDWNLTEKIPNFVGSNDTFPHTYMIVKFVADEDVELKIHFHLWQKRTQTTNGRMHYLGDSTKTIDYDWKMQGEGEYICNLRCPIKKTAEDTTVYTDTLQTIICYGGIKEFTDYDIVYDYSVQDREIKKAFSLTEHPVERYESEFDLTPYWITGFDYKFDLSQLDRTTEQLEYQSFRIFRLCLHDKWSEDPKQFAAWCTFSVEWINV